MAPTYALKLMFLSKLQEPYCLAYAEFPERSTGVCVNANRALNRVTYTFVGLLGGNVALLRFAEGATSSVTR
jgi:hypothetical protein